MEITGLMMWGFLTACSSVAIGVLMARTLGKKDDLVSEKILKLHLEPINITSQNILDKIHSAEKSYSSIKSSYKELNNRVLELERRE